MMDGPDVALASAVSTFPTSCSWGRAGFVSIHQPKSKVKKKMRIMSLSPSTASYSSLYSRSTATARLPKTFGVKPSLATPRARRVPSGTAIVPETEALNYQQAGWDLSIPLSQPSCLEEEMVQLDTGTGTAESSLFSSAPYAQSGIPFPDDWCWSNPSLLPDPGVPDHTLLHQPAPELFADAYPPQENHILQAYPNEYVGLTGLPAGCGHFYPFLGPAAGQPTMVSEQDAPQAYDVDGPVIGPYPAHPCQSMPVYGTNDLAPGDWHLRNADQPSEDLGPNISLDIHLTGSCPGGTGAYLDGGDALGHDPFYFQHEASTDVSTSSSPAGSGVDRPERQRRKRLEGTYREQTGQTRRWKACIRCRMQKIRCKPDLRNPERGDCLTCRSISQESKKVIHRLPCLRWKLTETVLFREGGLDLTARWTGVKVKDINPKDWVDSKTRSISISLGLCNTSLVLSVKKFQPIRGDVTWRDWVDRNANAQRTDIEPYALANINQTAKDYLAYVNNNAADAIRRYAENVHVDGLVRRTFMAAYAYATSEKDNPKPNHQPKADDVDTSEFLKTYFRLWLATRYTIGSAYIDSEDKLDMASDPHPDYPYKGKVSVPRMVSAQFDSFGYSYVLSPLRKQVLEGLWKMIASKNQHHFFTIYLTVFMMLHEVSVVSRDRRRRALHTRKNCRYDLAPFVEKLQEGANIILSHWHYYKRDFNPLAAGPGGGGTDKIGWGSTSSSEIQFLAESYQEAKNREPLRAERQPLLRLTWEDDLFFVSQMFEENWQPRKTFTA
ncbi:hypothetical protein F5X96DRAFT_237377 [Biscogniauxia mediterranea]|nr:hypothetical protein F5X96DRAFT_237377 [Biscogniauxia mediterranea]